MDEKIKALKELIEKSGRIVFFGGAGVSTESGIPDFRSKDGLYNQKYKYPPEEILSRGFFFGMTEEFYKFYRDKMNALKYEPNITHIKLAELEESGKLSAVITQNIDGLHQKAGSRNVLELHGSIYRNYCLKCRKSYGPNAVFGVEGIPRCSCGGLIKPDVVLYGEPLNEEIINKAINCISGADLLIIGGTSLSVYPASGLISFFSGKNTVLINKGSTGMSEKAELVINDSLGNVFSQL